MQACRNPDDTDDIPKHLPAGFSTYVLNSLTKSPPYHVTLDNVSPPPERLEVEQVSGHQLVRGRGGFIAVLYETRWTGLLSPSWEREMDLPDFRSHILRYWSGTPTQHDQTNRPYRQMRIGAARRKLWWSRCETFLAPGYGLVPRTLWLQHFSSSPLPSWAHIWYKARNGLLRLANIAHHALSDASSSNTYIVRFLDDPGPIKIDLSPSSYTTSRDAIYGSWCLQRHQAEGLARGVLRNPDAPRGAHIAPLAHSPRPPPSALFSRLQQILEHCHFCVVLRYFMFTSQGSWLSSASAWYSASA